MKFYIHVRNEEVFFNVRANTFDQAIDKVDLILDKLNWEHDFGLSSEIYPIAAGKDFNLRVNREGNIKGALYDSIHDKIIYQEMLGE